MITSGPVPSSKAARCARIACRCFLCSASNTLVFAILNASEIAAYGCRTSPSCPTALSQVHPPALVARCSKHCWRCLCSPAPPSQRTPDACDQCDANAKVLLPLNKPQRLRNPNCCHWQQELDRSFNNRMKPGQSRPLAASTITCYQV